MWERTLAENHSTDPDAKRVARSEAALDIEPLDTNQGGCIPAAVARVARLHADHTVCLTLEQGCVSTTQQLDQPLGLAERLARFDPDLHCGETMVIKPVGGERS